MGPDWDRATELILRWESFRPFVYDDAFPNVPYQGGPVTGTLTVGYGETSPELVEKFKAGITEKAALELFKARVPEYWKGIARHITIELNPNQCAALTSLSYNSGPNGIKVHAPALLAAINERRFSDAARLWRSSIVNPGTIFEQGLRNRRATEAELFATPWRGGDSWPDLFCPVLAS